MIWQRAGTKAFRAGVAVGCVSLQFVAATSDEARDLVGTRDFLSRFEQRLLTFTPTSCHSEQIEILRILPLILLSCPRGADKPYGTPE